MELTKYKYTIGTDKGDLSVEAHGYDQCFGNGRSDGHISFNLIEGVDDYGQPIKHTEVLMVKERIVNYILKETINVD